jgi:hypothetical protein
MKKTLVAGVLAIIIAGVAYGQTIEGPFVKLFHTLSFVPATTANKGNLGYDNAHAFPRYSNGANWVPVTGAETIVFATAGEAIDVGELVAIDGSGGSALAFKANADSTGAAVRKNPIGIARMTVGISGFLSISVSGEVIVPDTEWNGGVTPVATLAGVRVYLSDSTPGNWTTTAPSGSGDMAIRTGILSQGGGTAAKVILQFGEGTFQ